MSWLRIYSENDPEHFRQLSNFNDIADEMRKAGIVLERWHADGVVPREATQEQILAAYDAQVGTLMKQRGYATADVISVTPETPGHGELRKKFLDEHTHSEDEARFFVEGSGLFYIHANERVYALLCEKSDLIVVPANTRHWFDMGPSPFLKVIRTFTTPEGWVADFTGSDIAARYPRFEALVPAFA